MSDYTLQATWSTKDALAGGQALKAISATELGTEFDAIAAASATKYDADDLASTAEAEALTVTNKLLTPSTLDDVLTNNLGLLKDINALTDPSADRILFYDTSTGLAAFLTASTGLTLSGTNLTTNDSAIVHDNLSGFVADEHIAHSGVSLTAGTGLTGGGDITSSRTFNVVANNGITAAADSIGLTDVASTSTNPVAIASGSVSLEFNSLSTRTIGNLDQAADSVIMSDNGVAVRVLMEDLGFDVASASGAFTVTRAGHVNKYIRCSHATGFDVTLNTGLTLEIGNYIVIEQTGAGQITIAGTATVNSPNGLMTADQYSTIVLTYVAADTWNLSGRSSTT